MDSATVLKILLVLTIAVYLGFTIVSYRSLPVFIVFENIVWAILYALSLLALHYLNIAWPTLAIASFNAGRVSHALVTSTGEIGRLALEHTPLFTLLLVLVILSAYLTSRG